MVNRPKLQINGFASMVVEIRSYNSNRIRKECYEQLPCVFCNPVYSGTIRHTVSNVLAFSTWARSIIVTQLYTKIIWQNARISCGPGKLQNAWVIPYDLCSGALIVIPYS